MELPRGMELTETRPGAAELGAAGDGPYRGISAYARPTLTIRWRTRAYWWVAVPAFLAMALLTAVAIHAGPDEQDGWVAHGMLGFFTLVALYFALAKVLNRITVRADGVELSAITRPIPMPDGVRISARDIAEIYVERNANGTDSVLARTRFGRRHRLVTLDTTEQARFLASRLIVYLDLGSASPEATEPRAPAAVVAEPPSSEGLDVTEDHDPPGLTIRSRRKGDRSGPVGLAIYASTITAAALADGEVTVVLLVHVVLALVAAYVAAGRFRNVHTVRVGGGALEVRTAPLPLRRPIRLLASDVRRVYVNDRTVCVVTPRRACRLVTLDTPGQARWIEQRLGERLRPEEAAA